MYYHYDEVLCTVIMMKYYVLAIIIMKYYVQL